MFRLWMVWRYLRDGRRLFSLTFVLSVLGIAIGVAALVISMAVVSGYETTLRQTVINVHGDLMILKRGEQFSNRRDGEEVVREKLPELQAMTPFALIEALVPGKRKVAGILLEGVDPGTASFVVNFSNLVIEGEADLTQHGDGPSALVGKGLAKNFDVAVGDEIRLVVPVNREGGAGFRPKLKKFTVRGILNFGRKDYDDRYVMTDLASAQAFGELGENISGWRVKISDYKKATEVQGRLEEALGPPYRVLTWIDANRNLFQAVKYEKAVIFVIVFLMVVAAAFNVASALFVNVVKRFRQISILRAVGADRRFIRSLFSIQGLIVGVLGVALGLILGWLGAEAFLKAQSIWSLFPGEVYKLDQVQVEMRMGDLILITFSTLAICYLATLAPARRGANLLPTEGLRYE